MYKFIVESLFTSNTVAKKTSCTLMGHLSSWHKITLCSRKIITSNFLLLLN